MKFDNKNTTFYFIVIFLFGLALRMVNLDLMPLSEHEAGWGLRAFGVSQGQAVEIGSQPAYVALTGFLFSLMGSSDALARFLPALVGSLLVWAPFLFRKRIGEPAALVLALGLSFDPGMVAVSRLAGGPMLGLGFTVLGLAAWQSGRSGQVGVWFSLAVLSHPTVFGAGIVSFVVWALLRDEFEQGTQAFPQIDRKVLLTAAGITVLVAGTYLLRYPAGISGIGASISQYFTGWFTPNDVSIVEMVGVLVVYQPLALVFALISLWRVWTNDDLLGKVVGSWFMVALLLTVAYPAHQVSDLVWVLLPMWGLASFEIPRYFKLEDGSVPIMTWVNMGLTFVLMALFWINLSNLAYHPAPPLNIFWENLSDLFILDRATQMQTMSVIMIYLIPILTVLSSFLIGAGWDSKYPFQGFVWGMSLFVGLYMIGAAYAGAHIPKRAVNDLWWIGQGPGYSDLLVDTIQDVAELNNGDQNSIDVGYVTDSDTAAWALRKFTGAEYLVGVPQEPTYSVVVTSGDTVTPLLDSVYAGQDFALNRDQTVFKGQSANFLRWMIFRDVETLNEKVILWVRADLFPDGGLLQGGN